MPALPKPATVAKPVLLFCLVYLPVIAGWISLKHYYTWPVACAGAGLAAFSLDAEMDSCHYKHGEVKASFTRYIATSLGVYPSNSVAVLNDNFYTFNVPITLTMLIVASMLMHIAWQSWSKALMALFFGHCLYTYSCFLYRLQLFHVVVDGRELVSVPPVAVQLLWDFCNSMLIRFEPFLILAVLILVHRIHLVKQKA